VDCKYTTIFAPPIQKKIKIWKVREIIRYVEDDGWYLVSQQKGSHRQFKHPTKKGRVTILGNLSDDILPLTAKSILRQAGLM